MTKAELIKSVSEKAGITKVDAAKAVDAMIKSILESLKKGEKVTLVGFGNFYVSKRKARTGRNPKTGQQIKIPAAKVPKFSAGKALKEAIK